MPPKVRATNMTEAQAKTREAIMGSLAECIDEIMKTTDGSLSPEERNAMVYPLKHARGAFNADSKLVDGSVLRFFNTAAGRQFLTGEGIQTFVNFFARPLTTLQRQCKQAGEEIPPALVLLHKKYHERRGDTRKPLVNSDPLASLFSSPVGAKAKK